MLTLGEVASSLIASQGSDFEKSVADAFSLLGFETEQIKTTQAESDVLVKAELAERPFLVVIECNAVGEGSKVGYMKLGQIRGNYVKYATKFGGRFKNAYKMIVGRPDFSDDIKHNSVDAESGIENVALLTSRILIKILELTSKFHFSQDELEPIFKCAGEIPEIWIDDTLRKPMERRFILYSLIYVSLLREPRKGKLHLRKNWTPIEQLLGSVKALSYLLIGDEPLDGEVNEAIRDLTSPFFRILAIRNTSEVRLSSTRLENMTRDIGDLGPIFLGTLVEVMRRISSQPPAPDIFRM